MSDPNVQNRFKVGDWVEVRSREEVFSTLDSNGELEGMPFMPEMLQYCGKKFKVHKQAHKTCDYSVYPFRSRRLKDAVHLETRCSGTAHDDCQAGCLLYWKHAWLKPIDPGADLVAVAPAPSVEKGLSSTSINLSVLQEMTRTCDGDRQVKYRCQTTQIPYATTNLNWWDLRQYVQDVRSKNISIGRLLSGAVYSAFFHLHNAGIGLGPAMRWLYDRVCWIWKGSLFPPTNGRLPQGARTPNVVLNLRPGELVRVKTHEEILDTVDAENKNRGMYWGPELVPYCGKTFRVQGRVERLIDEKTSTMINLKNPCIILDSVVCQARYSQCRMFCPREMYPYWRETWLERVESSSSAADETN